MSDAAIDRLLMVRRVALARDDLGLLRECDAALVRLGVTPPPVPTAFADENTVLALPLEAAVRRTRVRPRK